MTAAPLELHRSHLLAGIDVRERYVDAAGIDTAVLEAGDGPSIVLLHGPGESAVNWRWTMPDLMTTNRVIAPDLPAHGRSGTGDGRLDAQRAIAWLAAVVEATCPEPPVIVGHVLGGAIAARYAFAHPSRLRLLVLVDSLGLARFRPSLRFTLSFLRFASRPSERSYERFMDQCAYDREELARRMGDDWPTFVAYNLCLARAENTKAAAQLFRAAGVPRIPASELAGIDVPTTLIWGRQDRALRLRVAERASRRHEWGLHVIDAAADDPPRDQPAEFLRVLRAALQGD